MAEALELMLQNSARLTVGIKRAYSRVKRDPSARYFTYVLMLQNQKFYVGVTDNIYNRLLDHCSMSPSSSVWVREHGPVKRVVELSRNGRKDDENYKTLEYMSMFGWKNVRGAGYCRSVMGAPPAPLADFRRDDTRRFDYFSRPEIDQVVATVRELMESPGSVSSATSVSEPHESSPPAPDTYEQMMERHRAEKKAALEKRRAERRALKDYIATIDTEHDHERLRALWKDLRRQHNISSSMESKRRRTEREACNNSTPPQLNPT